MSNPWIIGVSTGVISSIIIVLFSLILKNFLIPIIRGFINRIPDIKGEWDIFRPDIDPENSVGRVVIKQYGSRVKARLNMTRVGIPADRAFIFSGHFYSGQLIGVFEEERNRGYIVGTVVFKLTSTGREFIGKSIFLHHDTGEIVSQPNIMHRVV